MDGAAVGSEEVPSAYSSDFVELVAIFFNVAEAACFTGAKIPPEGDRRKSCELKFFTIPRLLSHRMGQVQPHTVCPRAFDPMAISRATSSCDPLMEVLNMHLPHDYREDYEFV